MGCSEFLQRFANTRLMHSMNDDQGLRRDDLVLSFGRLNSTTPGFSETSLQLLAVEVARNENVRSSALHRCDPY